MNSEFKKTSQDELDPQNAKSYYIFGVFYSNQRKFNEAAACFKKAIEINPNYIDAHYQLGLTYAEQGDFDQARKCCKKVNELNGPYTIIHN